MNELTVIRFSSRRDGDPYRCSLPNDQSGKYYRKSEVDAELERLREDRNQWKFLAAQLQTMLEISINISEANDAIDEARKE